MNIGGKAAAARILGLSVAVLLVPLVAMAFTDEVDWRLGDFVVGALLLVAAGVAYGLVARRGRTAARRRAVGIAVVIALVVIWAGLAVGLP